MDPKQGSARPWMLLPSHLPRVLLLLTLALPRLHASEFGSRLSTSSGSGSRESGSREDSSLPLSAFSTVALQSSTESSPEFHGSDFILSSASTSEHSGSEPEERRLGLTMDSRENLALREDFLREMHGRWARRAATQSRLVIEEESDEEETDDGPHGSDFEFTSSSDKKQRTTRDAFTASDSSSLEIRRVDPITRNGRNLDGCRRRESTEEILRQTLQSQKEITRSTGRRRGLHRSNHVRRPSLDAGNLLFSVENEAGMRMDLNTEEAMEAAIAGPKLPQSKPRGVQKRPGREPSPLKARRNASENTGATLSPDSISRLAHQLSGVMRRSSSGCSPTISNSRAPSPHETSGSASSFEDNGHQA